MSLERRSSRWVRAAIISEKARLDILTFEGRWRRKATLVLVALFGAPVMILGLILAIAVAYTELSDNLVFVFDLLATTMLAIGCFHIILKKLVARGGSISMSLSNFLLGAGLIIAAIELERLSPYRTLIIWAALILFSSLLARRLFAWLVGVTVLYVGALYAVREILGPNSDLDPYLGVALLMGALTPFVLFTVWFYRSVIRSVRWFWNLQLTKALFEFVKGEIIRILEWWWSIKVRARATAIWMGKVRRFIVEFVIGAFVGVGTRKHFELLDALLWQSQTIYLWGTLILWGVLFTLLPKEKYKFSMYFAFFASLEIFLHLASFGGRDGFRVALDGSRYHTGHFALGIILMYTAAWAARKLTWDKKTASEIFNLGPLGWLTAAGLLAFV
jgi:hypothetical protein